MGASKRTASELPLMADNLREEPEQIDTLIQQVQALQLGMQELEALLRDVDNLRGHAEAAQMVESLEALAATLGADTPPPPPPFPPPPPGAPPHRGAAATLPILMAPLAVYAHNLEEEWQPATDDEASMSLPQRLLLMFDRGLHADLSFRVGDTVLRAHRFVLHRNPDLCVASGEILVSDISFNTLRTVVRAHYMEASDAGRCLWWEVPDVDKEGVEALFGDGVMHWLSLQTAVTTRMFRDVCLKLNGGHMVYAHSAMLAACGVVGDNENFFTGAFRWPGAQHEGVTTVEMSPLLSLEATEALLRLRYDPDEVEEEHVLEVLHFASLFSWPDVRARCEACLRRLLAKGAPVEPQTVVAALGFSEESASMSSSMKWVALAAAVRNWLQVSHSGADAAMNPSRTAELCVLSRLSHRNGHICGSLKEYLLAAADDLVEFESTMPDTAPYAVKKQLREEWDHFTTFIGEYGRIYGRREADRMFRKVQRRRPWQML